MAKKKEFYEELPTKECPECGELCMEEDTVCDNCGHQFEEAEKLTEEEALDLDVLFGELDKEEPAEEEPEVAEPAMEEPFEEVPEVAEEEPEVLPEGSYRCPECNFVVTEEDVYCPNCSHQLKEAAPPEPASPLLGIQSEYQFAERGAVDYSNAIAGDRVIVRKEGDKYIALMCPFAVPVEVVDVDADEAEMLKADHILRCQPQLTVEDIVESGYTLKNSEPYLEKYYNGQNDIDKIYGEGLSQYANVKEVDDGLIKSGLSVDVLEILKPLKATEQKTLVNVLNKLEATQLTRASAHCIVEGERDEASMMDIVSREIMTRHVVDEMIAQRTNQQ